MGKMSRRALLTSITAAGLGAPAVGAAPHIPQPVTVGARVIWSDNFKLVKLEPEGEGPSIVLEVDRPAGGREVGAPHLPPLSRCSLILSPPASFNAPWHLHHIVAEDGERLELGARLLSLTWDGPHLTADILEVVAGYYDVTITDILSCRMSWPVLHARQMAIHLMRQLTTHPPSEIGRRIGNRDFTTVLHAIRKIEKATTADPRVRDDIQRLRQQVTT